MRRAIAATLAALLALGLAGCSPQHDAAYPPSSAETLQTGVLAVSEAASAGDAESALTRLDELQAALLDCKARGAIGDARFDSISAAIALVRADLESVVAEQNSTENPDDSPGKSDSKPGKPDKPDKPDKP